MNGQLAIFDISAPPAREQAWREYLSSLGYASAQVKAVTGKQILSVFRDPSASQCLALIKVVDPDSNHLPEFGDLARKHGAEFIAVGYAESYTVYQVGPYAISPAPVRSLPSLIARQQRRKPIPKTCTLLPFRDEDHLRSAFAACHDAIYVDRAKDPAAAFDVLSLVVAAKVMDEQSEGSAYEFSELVGERESAAVSRFLALLHAARTWIAAGDSSALEGVELPTLSYTAVTTILRELQDFSLTLTGASPAGTDLLGIAYEQLVGATFRGELGSYFTPRNVADFMVRLLDVRAGRVFDPSCGSGGLLVAAHRYAKSLDSKCDPELYGNDLNPRMVQAAKVNFLVHRVDPSHVLRGDGLELSRMVDRWFDTRSDASDRPLWDGAPGPFDFVLANPPFAGHEKNELLLKRIATAYRADGSLRSLNRTLPFLELIVASLAEGGRAGIVLPTSILNAEEESFVRFRELLLCHAEIVAIIGLPEKAFVHTDCGVHGALLFFERRSKPRKDYDLFIGWVEHLGYDRLGKPTRSSDFPALVERFHSKTWHANERVSVRDLVAYKRWDPAWLRIAKSLPTDDSERFVRLSELVEIRNARWSRTQLRADELYRYFEVSDADLHTGEVSTVRTATGFELEKKGRIRNQVKTGDILLPNHRDSLIAGSAVNGRSVVVADSSLDGVLTTDRFMVLRPKIDPVMLAELLNSSGVRRQLVARCRGAASLDIREHTLRDVLIPKSLLTPGKIAEVGGLSEDVTKLRKKFEKTRERLSETIESEFTAE